MAHGWSVKHLIREIVLSATWRQISDALPVAEGAPDPSLVDPENLLTWRMNRRRRDFESFRDSLLFVSGRLDATVGGRPVEIDSPDATRRSLYGFIDRQNLPGLFRAFDFASPDQHAPRRFQTTVPQQALFALNNPFVLKQAAALAALPAASDDERLTQLARRVLGRNLDDDERRSLLDFIAHGPRGRTAGAWDYGFGEVAEDTGATRFTPLPWHGKDRWSASEAIPDPGLSYTMLTAGGGHPGPRPDQAVILRWQSPEAATVVISGELKRPAPEGDGVRLRLVSATRGLLHTWDAPAASTVAVTVPDLPLAEGEILDFVIDAKAGDNSDSFQFAPKIQEARTRRLLADAAEEFAGPALDPWTACAQVLLVGNEFMFVD